MLLHKLNYSKTASSLGTEGLLLILLVVKGHEATVLSQLKIVFVESLH